jgi:hypothetical protein
VKRSLSVALALALLVGLVPVAKAGFVDTLTVSPGGTNNSYHDASYEHIYYQNGAAGIQVGDVIVGFNQINIKQQPNSLSTFNTIYTVFSQQVTAISPDGTVITFGATPAGNAHSLQSILSGSGLTIPTGTFAMLFDRPQNNQFSQNLINNPPPGATSMNDYIKFIAANGTYEFSAGFTAGHPDFLSATLGTLGGNQLTASSATAALLNGTPESVNGFVSFTGGFTIGVNNTGDVFNETVIGSDLLAHQVVLANGIVKGASDAPGVAVFAQPGPNDAGVTDSADIVVNVSAAAVVPEPGSMVMLSIGLVTLAAARFGRKKRTDKIA